MPLTTYSVEAILRGVAWTVEVTDDFERWWDRLTEDERVSIDGMIRVLEAQGPSLQAPYSAGVVGSSVAQLRQLRVPHGERDICVLYVSEPSRLVLLTGSTTGTQDEVCPPDEIAMADAIYRRFLAQRHGSRH